MQRTAILVAAASLGAIGTILAFQRVPALHETFGLLFGSSEKGQAPQPSELREQDHEVEPRLDPSRHSVQCDERESHEDHVLVDETKASGEPESPSQSPIPGAANGNDALVESRVEVTALEVEDASANSMSQQITKLPPLPASPTAPQDLFPPTPPVTPPLELSELDASLGKEPQHIDEPEKTSNLVVEDNAQVDDNLAAQSPLIVTDEHASEAEIKSQPKLTKEPPQRSRVQRTPSVTKILRKVNRASSKLTGRRASQTRSVLLADPSTLASNPSPAAPTSLQSHNGASAIPQTETVSVQDTQKSPEGPESVGKSHNAVDPHPDGAIVPPSSSTEPDPTATSQRPASIRSIRSISARRLLTKISQTFNNSSSQGELLPPGPSASKTSTSTAIRDFISTGIRRRSNGHP